MLHFAILSFQSGVFLHPDPRSVRHLMENVKIIIHIEVSSIHNFGSEKHDKSRRTKIADSGAQSDSFFFVLIISFSPVEYGKVVSIFQIMFHG